MATSVRGLLSGKRFWAIFVVYDQEINYAWPEGSIPNTGEVRYEEKFSCIGPEVDDPYVPHIPAAPCSELLSGGTQQQQSY